MNTSGNLILPLIESMHMYYSHKLRNSWSSPHCSHRHPCIPRPGDGGRERRGGGGGMEGGVEGGGREEKSWERGGGKRGV